MSTFRLNIVTHERVVLDAPVQKVIVRTTEGDVGILKNHIRYVAALDIGPIKVVGEDSKVRIAAVSGGFINVGKDMTTIVAQSFEWADEIDVDRAQNARTRALKQIEENRNIDYAQVRLKRALNRINVASK